MNMPLELITRLMDQTAEFYPKAKIGYGFTEPLIYPHLGESLIHARKLNLYTSITTNALNLRQKADVILDAEVDDIFISLDGLEETHNFIRGHKSSFQRAIEGMEKLFESSTPPDVSIFCVITNWNQHELLDFVKFFERYPIKRLGFMHTNFTSESMAEKHNRMFGDQYPATVSNIDEFDPKSLDLKALNAEIKQVKSRNSKFDVVFSPELNSLAELETFYLKPDTMMGSGCRDIFRNVMVKSDGSVIPAHGRCYNLSIGNMNEQNLKEIWNSAIIKQFRKDIHKAGGLFPACARCCSAF